MPTEQPPPRSRMDVSAWSDPGSREALDLVASSVAELVGFEIAIISMVREDRMYSVSVEGSDEIRAAMLGVATPMEMVLPELERADDWGRFRFVPHDRVDVEEVGAVGWIPDIDVVEGPDAWHPLDLLIAPLLGEDGAMVGLLSIDIPMDGRRPGPAQRHVLERYAAQAEKSLRLAVQRDELAQRTRLAEAARSVVRAATLHGDLDQVLDESREPILEGFRADFLVLRTYETADSPQAGTPVLPVDDEIVLAIREAARRCWVAQRVSVFSETSLDEDVVDDATHRRLVDLAGGFGVGVAMLVPIGAGSECLGLVIMGRKDPEHVFGADEQASALDLARDIGQAVLNSRNLRREQRMVAELKVLAAYKSQVLSTVSHELKNPLSAIAGHVEMLEGRGDLPERAGRSVAALGRASERMRRVVDDLLLLAAVEDPDASPDAETVDVRDLLEDAVELNRMSADRRELRLVIEAPESAVLTRGDASDLDRVLTNLVSNAVKYTPTGGSVTVSVADRGSHVELAVSDTGIGISEADQHGLFTEFFRSTNPQAVAQPGTGLGLTIASRIVERHGGRIEVDSKLGVGSTFTVVLPHA